MAWQRLRTWKKATIITLAILGVLLLGLRIATPYILREVVNDKLADLPEYWGSVDDVDVHLWRGAFGADNLRLIKRGSGRKTEPFVFLPRTDVGIEWKAIFEGKIVAKVELERPRVNLIVAESKKQSQTEPPKGLAQVLLDMTPLDINRFEIEDGTLHFKDERTTPVVDMTLDHLQLVAHDLSTRPAEGKGKRPSQAELTARVLGQGRVKAKAKANMFSPDHPAIDLDLALENLPLTALRDFTRGYASFDFERGELDVYTEIAAANKVVEGYVKPLIRDAQVVDTGGNDSGDNPAELAWELFVGALTGVLENRPFDAVATKIPIEGRIDQPDVDVWSTIGGLIGNAFLKALLPRLDGTITLDQLGKSPGPRRAS
jgi:hypothetical protein